MGEKPTREELEGVLARHGLMPEFEGGGARGRGRPAGGSGEEGEEEEEKRVEGEALRKYPLRKGMYRGKRKAGVVEVVQWIFDNVAVGDVAAEDAPSAGAWAWMQQVRKDTEVRRDFFRSVYPKLMPSRTVMEQESRFGGEEEDREVRGTLEKLAERWGKKEEVGRE